MEIPQQNDNQVAHYLKSQGVNVFRSTMSATVNADCVWCGQKFQTVQHIGYVPLPAKCPNCKRYTHKVTWFKGL